MRKNIFKVVLLLLVIHPLLGFGQKYYSRNFTVTDGLPANTIRSIIKDSHGVMWFGTSAGLCRFNGREFKVYNSQNGLAGDNVWSITADDRGNLWIGCMKDGISKFDGKTFTNYNVKQGLVSDNVRVVWFSPIHRLLFIGTNNGCSVFDGKSFTNLSEKDKTELFYVMGFLEGETYITIYTYQNRPSYRFYPDKCNFGKVVDPYYLTNPPSTHPVILSNGDTLIGSYRENLNILHNGVAKSFKHLGQVFDLEKDDIGNVWIAAWAEDPVIKDMPGGLYRYDGKGVERWSEKVGMTDPSVWSLFYDTTFHILWVGTLNKGLFKIPAPLFEWFDKETLGVSELDVKALLPLKDSTLWIGTHDNLIIKSPDGKFKTVDNDLFKNFYSKRRPDRKDFCCFGQDTKGNIYVGSTAFNLIRFNTKNDYKIPERLIFTPNAHRFAIDKYDTLFFTSPWYDRIYRCSVTPVVSFPKESYNDFKKHNAPPNVVKMITDGVSVWYASRSEGLFRSINNRFDYLRKTDNTLPRTVNDICFDRSGNLIAGSNDGEVLIVGYDATRIKIKRRMSSRDGIVGSTINFITVDLSNNLFIGTNLGLNRIDLNTLFDKNQLVINFFGKENGYNDMTGQTCVTGYDGRVWIGTNGNLCKLNVDLLNKITTDTPKVSITGLDVNYKPYHFEDERNSYSNGEPIKLDFDQNSLVFHFETYNYLNPEQDMFRYKLKGADENWTPYSQERQVVFNSLSPGKYTLLVEVVNPINNINIGHLQYSFIILPPFYLRWWFIGIMLLLVFSGIGFGVRLRIKKIKNEEHKKSEITKQLANIEMRALQAQMNPHFVFNAINSIQDFVLKNNVDDALRYLSDFSRIIRQTLDNATKEFITLEEELDYIKVYLRLEQMRFEERFTIEINVPVEIETDSILIPPMIIQPYVENAIRHGLMHKKDEQGKLSIEFLLVQEKLLKCVVQDNGVGREKAQEIESWKNIHHSSQGTRITKDRIELLNKSHQSEIYTVNIIDLCDSQGIGSGTKVEILFPI